MMDPLTRTALAWLLTYAIHSTALLLLAWLLSRWSRLSMHAVDFIWKLALVGGLFTASAQLALDVRPSGSFALDSGPSAITPLAAPGDAVSRPAIGSGAGQAPQAPAPNANANGAAIPTTIGGAAAPVQNPAASGTTVPTGDRFTGDALSSSATSARTLVERALVFGWALGALLLALAYVARRLMLVGRLANRQTITEGPLPSTLEALCRAVGFRARVRLTSVNTIASPVALGLHEICVPDAALTDLSIDEQRGLLAHELAHLARRDPLWLDLASLMERVFFFQPLNRLARREIQRNAEFLCDDWAAERMGAGLPLAHCLARVAEWIEASPLGVPVAGMAEQRSLLVTRIARLLEGRRAGSPLSRMLAVGGATVLLSAVVAAAPGVRQADTAASTRGAASRATPMSALSGTAAFDVGASTMASHDTSDHRTAGHPDNEVNDTGNPDHASRAEIAGEFSGHREFDADTDIHDEPDDSRRPALSEDPAVVAALIERLRDSDAGVRRAAANALGNLRNTTAVPALIAAIGDRDREMRRAVCRALGEIGDPRAVSALTRMLGDESSAVRHDAIEALGEFSERLTASMITPSTQDPNAETRAKAAELLGEIGDRSAAPVLQRLLNDTSAQVRERAVEALGRLRVPDAGPMLLSSLDDPVIDVRTVVVEALGQLRIAVPARNLTALLSDESAQVRKAALEYLEEQPALADVATIRRLLSDNDEEVREQAVEVLAELSGPEARAALREALSSRDPGVRRRAAEALGNRR